MKNANNATKLCRMDTTSRTAAHAGPRLARFPLFVRKRVNSLAQAKRIEYLEESEEPSVSYAAHICDVVRAMVLCGRVEDLLDAYHAVMRAFNVVQGRGRVKMNFSEENTSKPPDV